MVYNFNLGIGWASSGVEYAQSYRANMLRRIGVKARFVFMDMFPNENIEHMTKNIGFADEEIIWLYTYFTDTKIAPVTFTLANLEKTFAEQHDSFSRNGKVCKYYFPNNIYYTVYMVDETSDLVHRVEIVSRDCLIRKDYYTYCKLYSEFYAPYDNKAHMYHRRFYNEDGSVAYEEMNDDGQVFYKFPDRVLCSKEELVGYMVEKMQLTSSDVAIIDRTTGIGSAIMRNCNDARIGIVIHADHFSESGTDENNILWNNYYEFSFAQHRKVDFYITATDAQNRLVREQFRKYKGVEPNVVTIPVGSLDELKFPEKGRKKHSVITASRLATEKHCDWLVEAVVKAREAIPDVSLDIYGKGTTEETLRNLIKRLDCGEYVRLMGQQKLDEVYREYEVYMSASQSEGFGLTLMEAIGSGLPIIGFDVRYGNQNFIDEGQNGYRIPVTDEMDKKEKIDLLAEKLIKLFTEDDLEAFSRHSYEKAEVYLTSEVEKRWNSLINQVG